MIDGEYYVISITFKYHVSCTDGKISVRINVLFYLYFPPSSHLHTYIRYVYSIHILDGTTVENKSKTIN